MHVSSCVVQRQNFQAMLTFLPSQNVVGWNLEAVVLDFVVDLKTTLQKSPSIENNIFLTSLFT